MPVEHLAWVLGQCRQQFSTVLGPKNYRYSGEPVYTTYLNKTLSTLNYSKVGTRMSFVSLTGLMCIQRDEESDTHVVNNIKARMDFECMHVSSTNVSGSMRHCANELVNMKESFS